MSVDNLRSRLRQRAAQPQTMEVQPSDQQLSPVMQNGSHPKPSTLGHPQTSPNQDKAIEIFSAPDLRTRMVRYFQYIAENIPAGSFSPMVQALARRLFPMFAKEVQDKFTDDDIERTGTTALLILAKLYRPNAERVVLDFSKGTMEVLGDEPPVLELLEEDQQLLAAADAELAALGVNEILAPPPPDMAQLPVVVEDDDPIIGVQFGEKVVRMRQSEYQRLMQNAME